MDIVCVVGHAVDELVKFNAFVAQDPVEVNVAFFILKEPLTCLASSKDGDEL